MLSVVGKFSRFCLSVALTLAVLVAPDTRAEDWPQWLGPNRDGASPEMVAPWKQPPRVLWRHKTPEGNSAPVVGGFDKEGPAVEGVTRALD